MKCKYFPLTSMTVRLVLKVLLLYLRSPLNSTPSHRDEA